MLSAKYTVLNRNGVFKSMYSSRCIRVVYIGLDRILPVWTVDFFIKDRVLHTQKIENVIKYTPCRPLVGF